MTRWRFPARTARGTPGTVARLFEVDANHKARLDQVSAGQIVLLAGLRWATTGDTCARRTTRCGWSASRPASRCWVGD